MHKLKEYDALSSVVEIRPIFPAMTPLVSKILIRVILHYEWVGHSDVITQPQPCHSPFNTKALSEDTDVALKSNYFVPIMSK